ncbi:MAG: glycosyltransferase [Tannerellaceae bacterium]|jgi:hypothetical protein|nr:glycosyltransferase [Tannerellaceae bacterium]
MDSTLPMVYVLIGVTTGLFVVQSGYWLLMYARPLRKPYRKTPKGQKEKAHTPPVSVVLYAGHDTEKLQDQLLALLGQDYPCYEVVVVTDNASDESEGALKILEKTHANFYHTYIPEGAKYVSRKKLALTIGIKAAKHDILLFTEAHCLPVSKKWIASFSQAYLPETEIVQGLCAYRYTEGFMHRFIAYDNLLDGMQCLSATLARHPFTGSGRNLSYRKSLFFNKKGYYQSLALHDGDDDLFVNESATPRNTRIVYSPESVTEMPPVQQFEQWMEGKFAHAVTRRRYKGGMPLLFRMETLSYFLFFGLGIATIIAGVTDEWGLSIAAGVLILVRHIVKAVILHKASALFHQKPVTAWLFVLEFIHPLCEAYIYVRQLFRHKREYTFRLK